MEMTHTEQESSGYLHNGGLCWRVSEAARLLRRPLILQRKVGTPLRVIPVARFLGAGYVTSEITCHYLRWSEQLAQDKLSAG